MAKNNPGFNTWNIPGRVYPRSNWPGYESKMYNEIGAMNRRREKRLTEEQAAIYNRMMSYWLERGAYYRDTANYPDDLCAVLACRDTLNAAILIAKNGNEPTE